MSSSVESTVADGVGTILLNRPEVMNAISVTLAEALEAALWQLSADDGVSVIVIRGAGGNFCAGGDFDEVQRLRARGADELDGLFAAFRRACSAMRQVAPPVVVVVEGVAMAGGFELVQAADIALVSDDARLSDNHANFGMVPGGGGSQRLPRLIGRQRALGHLLTGERLTGAEAHRMGLAHRSFPAEEFEDAVAEFLTRLSAKNPAALRSIKRLVHDGLDLPLEQGLDLEQRTVVDHIIGRAGADIVAAFSSRSSS